MVFFSVLLPRMAGLLSMVICYILALGIYQFACPPQSDWMVNCVEGHVKSNYYSIRETFFMIAYTIMLCAVSLIIDWGNRYDEQKMSFLIVGTLVAVLLMVSIPVLFCLPSPEEGKKDLPSPALAALLEPIHNKHFRQVMLTNMVWSFSNMFIAGFAAVYQVRVLEVTFFEIMLWMTIANVCRSFCTPLMARLASKIGWTNVVGITIAMMAGTAGLWMVATKENIGLLFPVLTIMGAIPFAGMVVGFFKLQVATSRANNRSMYFSVYSMLVGVASMLGSVLCSALINVLEGYSIYALRYVFLTGIIGAIAAMVMAVRMPCREV